MNNRKKYALVAVIITVAGFTYIKKSHRNILSDISGVAAGNTELKTRVPVLEKDKGNIPVTKSTAAENVSKGYVAGIYQSTSAPTQPVEWVTIPGGKFMMGTDDFKDAKPIHEVAIKTFEMSKTAVTVEQYTECVIKSECTKPGTACNPDTECGPLSDNDYCNWGKPDRRFHPVNCVTWDQANQYARFKGARLPSESEWEYAAKSGGKNQKYSWGNNEPTCDKAVMYGNGNSGCSKYRDGTMPVCSKPAGNTEQGLCDMVGNMGQWVQDKYQNSYKGAPADGSAFEGEGPFRIARGGFFSRYLRVDSRFLHGPGDSGDGLGFRLARSHR